MKIKLIAAGCLVAASLGYLALKPKASHEIAAVDSPVVKTEEKEPAIHAGGSIPTEVQDNKPARMESAVSIEPTPTPEDQSTEEKLTSTLEADKELAKIAVIHSVQCAGGKCTIEMEAKEDEANIQMPMFEFIRNHPEYGQSFQFYARDDNPKVTQFTISKE